MNKTIRKGLIFICISMASGLLALYFLYLGFRKPQASLQQTENLAITLTSLDETDMTSLFGNEVFLAPNLHFLQSLMLTSSNPYFGGWSGMAITKNETHMIAVSDTGHWLETDLQQHHEHITAMNNARIGPLRDNNGNILRDSGYGDIEAISMSDDYVYLAFESYHSGIWSAQQQSRLEYTKFRRWISPTTISKLPIGRGLEALSIIDEKHQDSPLLLAIAERDFGIVNSRTPAWLIQHDRLSDDFIYIALSDDYDISDVAFHPQCGLFLLERKLTYFGRFYVRLLKLEPAHPNALANASQLRLFEASSAGEAIDNVEALAVVAEQAGDCHIYMLSDSNFLPIQKTVLLKFGYRS